MDDLHGIAKTVRKAKSERMAVKPPRPLIHRINVDPNAHR